MCCNVDRCARSVLLVRTKLMGLVDSHCHLFETGFAGRRHYFPHTDGELRAYAALRESHAIERSLVVAYEGKSAYIGNNDYVARLAAEHSWITPVAYLSPDQPPEPDRVDEFLARGFVGFAVYVLNRDDGEAVAAWPQRVVRHLSRHARVLSLNATPEAAGALGNVVGRLAPCAVLFSHLGLPGRTSRAPTREHARARLAPLLSLAAHGNVGVKVSGFYAASQAAHNYPHHDTVPYVDTLLDAFGAERLYWGSDFSPCLAWISFEQAVDVTLPERLSPDERERIFGGNLRRLLDHESTGPRPTSLELSAVEIRAGANLPAPQADFHGLNGRHYLYTGAEGPALRAHDDAIARYVRNKSAWEDGRHAHDGVMQSCRDQVAELIGGNPDNVALLSNASEALNRIIGSIQWAPGMNAVTTNLEFPSVVQPLLRLRSQGVEARVVQHRDWSLDVDDLARAIDDKTGVIVVSHVSYMSGLRLDLDALSRLAGESGVLLVVDATQSLGVIPVDATRADFVVSSTYKWMLGPHGVGVVYCSDPERLMSDPDAVGWRSVPDPFTSDRFERYELWPGARRLELGFPSFPSLYMLDASLRYLRSFSPPAVEKHVHALGSALGAGLASLGVKVVTPTRDAGRAGNITFLTRDGEIIARRLAEKGILAWGGDGRVRFSLHLFNDDHDVDATLRALPDVL